MQVLIFLCLIWSCAIVKAQECRNPRVVGEKQSPVNINMAKVKLVTTIPLVWSKEYAQSQSWKLINTGNTLQLVSRRNVSFQLSGGNLGATYTFQELHFHWGTTNDKGSEHTLNNKSLPLEMHGVHKQNNNENAKTYTIVTNFFKVTEEKNKVMEKILAQAIKAAKNKHVPQKVQPFAITDFGKGASIIPYFAYDGSLSSSPFTESVNRIIFTSVLTLSQTQMDIFREVANIQRSLKNNYRCIQKLNGRVISLVKQSG